MDLRDRDMFCITDVGSTTTKAILFARRDGGWAFFREEAPTTVEKPCEDVTIGLLETLRALEPRVGVSLVKGDAPDVPLLSTSSAGGGLAMVVTGIVSELTARTADRVALGAGAIVLDVLTMNDGRTPYRRIEDLRRLRPDMVLLAGGFDGDAISAPVFLAELIVESNLHPKLNPDARLPLVYGGNVNAREYVEQTLGDRFLFFPVENVRPEEKRENPRPARGAIHRIFMEHVMSQAPGYHKLVPWVDVPIRPTPAAFARTLGLVSKRYDANVLAIDIGGATTDVFTATGGEVLRTVSANLGMSYSALNVLEIAGPGAIRDLLGAGMSDEEIWNRVGDKHTNPTRLPSTPEDVALERAMATLAIRAATRDHMKVLDGTPADERPGPPDVSAMLDATGEGPQSVAPLGLTGYDLVIGSGGPLSHSPRDATARMLLDALAPKERVELAVDRVFMFPHLGVLSEIDRDLARELLFDIALEKLGAFDPEDGPDEALEALLREGGEASAPVGQTAAPPDVHVAGSRGGRERVSGTRLRERRELAIEGRVFIREGQTVETDTVVARSVRQFLRPFFLHVASIMKIEPEELPEVLLTAVGEEIAIGQVIAKQRWRPGRPAEYRSPVEGRVEKILPNGTLVVRERPEKAQVLTTVGVAKELGVHPEKLRPYLKVSPGDEVERGQWLAADIGTGNFHVVKSPVRGKVNRIDEKFGMVMIEPLLEEEEVLAWLPGIVEEVPERGCVVAGEGAEIVGVWGLGGEVAGPLTFGPAGKGSVVVREFPDGAALDEMAEAGIAGLVTAGVNLRDVLDRQPVFTVVVTEGFGARAFPLEVSRILEARAGKLALLDGTTQLRVGVRRPRIILPGSSSQAPEKPLSESHHSV